ncbi:cytochrome b/b6 domain-containing protein [Marinospirillum perlucidum]|uniref:cytochrome b/b6 domain-containing protein n=1 Tax=Marinospirillum perlucidum TaxID=1982602 RepID=UPI000DF3EA32|nr:cytochrome b/b6 domain-containing protein [Marinospirillum perlucidum]
MQDQDRVENIKVWDWSIRVFHWSLPVIIFALWYTRLDPQIHQLFAQVLMGLLIYRVIWGFVGTPYARFGCFVRSPGAMWTYLTGFLKGRKASYLGHNPLGGAMVVLLLLVMGLQLTTGLFIDDFLFPGPLYSLVPAAVSEWMTTWHHRFFNLLLALIVIHLMAILVYRLKGDNLVKAMLVGSKPADPQAADLDRKNQAFPWLRFLIAVVLAVLPVYWIFNGL